MVTITDPFFRKLYTKLAEEIENRSNVLISGGALTIGSGFGVDTTATAMSYQKAVAYIEALQAVIELGVEIDHERYGRRGEQNGDE